MTVMTKGPKTKGPGKYKIIRGTHSEGQRICDGCGERVYKKDFAAHEAEDAKRPEAQRKNCSVTTGTPVIYGAKNEETGQYPAGTNAGSIIDSRSDLSRLNTHKDKKFIWVGKGKYTPKSQERDTLESMSDDELRQFAEESEIPLGDDAETLSRDELLVAIRQAHA